MLPGCCREGGGGVGVVVRVGEREHMCVSVQFICGQSSFSFISTAASKENFCCFFFLFYCSIFFAVCI